VAPYARTRDRKVSASLRKLDVAPWPHGGSYLRDPAKMATRAGGPYTVFSPFHRALQSIEGRAVHRAPAELPALPSRLAKGRLTTGEAHAGGVPEPIVEAGEPAARAALERWLREPITHYADRHDGMSRIGTSIMSPWLRWGCLSARECEARAAGGGDGNHPDKGSAAWIRQLAWRDFYAHILLHFPATVRDEHQERYRGTLAWADPGEHLDAWKEGRTGYPLIDAGMRQLARTGWMHNRARLAVASFLTKDLHLDWREGERHFSALLLDGEPAQNVGNWQWIASTGVDPAPYFRRMFNPTLQAGKLDPGGTYIRTHVPELGDVPDERIHEPWTMSDAEQEAANCVIGEDYPAPIVDHAHERRAAIERYRAAAQG
jgi:deoxyribodipyrimidine photo-lyase